MQGTKLDDGQRHLLGKRLATIRARLDPGEEGDHQKAAALMQMFASYPNTKSDVTTAKAYLFAVRMHPAWAVEVACQMIVQDKVAGLDGRFCPSASQVAKVCGNATRKLVKEKESIDKLLEM